MSPLSLPFHHRYSRRSTCFELWWGFISGSSCNGGCSLLLQRGAKPNTGGELVSAMVVK